MGMKSEEEAVALQAIEFWTSVAEEETNLESDYLDAQEVRNGDFFPWVSWDQYSSLGPSRWRYRPSQVLC